MALPQSFSQALMPLRGVFARFHNRERARHAFPILRGLLLEHVRFLVDVGLRRGVLALLGVRVRILLRDSVRLVRVTDCRRAYRKAIHPLDHRPERRQDRRSAQTHLRAARRLHPLPAVPG